MSRMISLQMHLDLPGMLSALAEMIQRKLQKAGQLLLEEK